MLLVVRGADCKFSVSLCYAVPVTVAAWAGHTQPHAADLNIPWVGLCRDIEQINCKLRHFKRYMLENAITMTCPISGLKCTLNPPKSTSGVRYGAIL